MTNDKLNKRFRFGFWVIMLVAGLSLTSCLKDDDDDTIYYDDAAVTSFSLGTLNRYMHKKASSGLDSVYVQKVSCSNIKFFIDQQQGLIYNVDSLPYGLDLTKAVCTIVSKNSGVLMLNKGKEGRDSLVFYAADDSIDVSQPMEVRVANMKGTAYRSYQLTVNMHQEDGDEFRWAEAMDEQAMAALPAQPQRLLCVGDKVFGFGQKTDGAVCMMPLNPFVANDCVEFEPSALDNAVSNGSTMYVLEKESGKLYSWNAEDGKWNQLSMAETNVERLVGASTKEIYALSSEGGLLVSTDNGNTWQTENLDSDANLLPSANISCTVHALRTNDGMERVMLIGTCEGRSTAMAWMKIVDLATPGAGTWMLVTATEDDLWALPQQDALSVIGYGDVDVAYGMAADGTQSVMQSMDGGVTWKGDNDYTWPITLEAQPTSKLAVAVDGSNFIWMIPGDGSLWRGRLNKMGWKDVQMVFQ
ncbi:MAG: hypothetical protein IKW98_03765 [Prevotella sp.]|nr:hypothetical protein [Prevotella sp.]